MNNPVPDVLACHLEEAQCRLQGYSSRIVFTTPHGERGHGAQRVVRQRLLEDGKVIEVTIAAEDWGRDCDS